MGTGLAQNHYSNHYNCPHFFVLAISLLFYWILIPKNLWRCPDTFSVNSENFIKIWGGQFFKSIFTKLTATLAILLDKPRRGVRKVTFVGLPRHWPIEKSRSNNSNVTATFKNQIEVVIYRVQYWVRQSKSWASFEQVLCNASIFIWMLYGGTQDLFKIKGTKYFDLRDRDPPKPS